MGYYVTLVTKEYLYIASNFDSEVFPQGSQLQEHAVWSPSSISVFRRTHPESLRASFPAQLSAGCFLVLRNTYNSTNDDEMQVVNDL